MLESIDATSDPTRSPAANQERAFTVRWEGKVVGDGPAHLPSVPSEPGTWVDVFRECRASKCPVRPVYRVPREAVTRRRSADEDPFGEERSAERRRQRAIRPEPLEEADWTAIVKRWNEAPDPYDEAVQAANRALLKERREAREAAAIAAWQREVDALKIPKRWNCPVHGAARMVNMRNNYHNSGRHRVCLVEGCEARPWPDRPRPELVDPEPTGWACREHGLEAVVKLRSGAGRVYGACGMCDEFEDDRR